MLATIEPIRFGFVVDCPVMFSMRRDSFFGTNVKVMPRAESQRCWVITEFSVACSDDAWIRAIQRLGSG